MPVRGDLEPLACPRGRLSHGNWHQLFQTITGGVCRVIIHRLVEGPPIWELSLSSCHKELGELGSNREEWKSTWDAWKHLPVLSLPTLSFVETRDRPCPFASPGVPGGAGVLLKVLKALSKPPSCFCTWSCHFIKFFWSRSWPKLSTFLLTSTFATSLFTPRLLIKH